MKNAIILLFIVLSANLLSQATGVVGKKYIIKTNLVSGRDGAFNGIEVEYAAFRRWTVTASIQGFKYSRSAEGYSVATGEITPGNNRESTNELSVLKNGTTRGVIVSGGFRKYFNKILAAPYGWYTQMGLGVVFANYKDYDIDYIYTGSTGYPRTPGKVLSDRSVNLFIELPGLGFQKIIKKVVSLDLRVSIEGQIAGLPEEMIGTLEHNYFIRTNTVSYSYSRFTIGPAAYLKVGFILF